MQKLSTNIESKILNDLDDRTHNMTQMAIVIPILDNDGRDTTGTGIINASSFPPLSVLAMM
jgi:hypothetical protein